jgi:F-type H+-transporting ATPase subunit delta
MSNKTAAIRYARALFDVAMKEQADLLRVEQELLAFNTLFDNQPTLKKVLLNPAVPVPRKRDAMVKLTERAQTSPIVAKLLVLLAERDRLILLPDLAGVVPRADARSPESRPRRSGHRHAARRR